MSRKNNRMSKAEIKDRQERMTAIEEEIDSGSIVTEMVVATLMCNSLDIILRNVDSRIRAVYRKYGFTAKVADNENVLTGMKRYSEAVHNALYWFGRDTEKRIESCTFDSSGVVAYDDFKCSANELARFCMLLVDRGKADGAMKKIFEFMLGLEPGGRFSQEDIDRYILR